MCCQRVDLLLKKIVTASCYKTYYFEWRKCECIKGIGKCLQCIQIWRMQSQETVITFGWHNFYLNFQIWSLCICFPKIYFRVNGLRKFWTILTALFQNVMKPHHLLVFDKYCDKNRATRNILCMRFAKTFFKLGLGVYFDQDNPSCPLYSMEVGMLAHVYSYLL